MTSPQLRSDSMVKARRFSSKMRNKTRMSTIAIFIQHSTVSPSQSNYTKKKKKKERKKEKASKLKRKK